MSIWQSATNPMADEPLTTAQRNQESVAELVAWWHAFRAATLERKPDGEPRLEQSKR